jgi:hypothetical protein
MVSYSEGPLQDVEATGSNKFPYPGNMHVYKYKAQRCTSLVAFFHHSKTKRTDISYIDGIAIFQIFY